MGSLERLAKKIHPRFAHDTSRAACGLSPVPQGEKINLAGASAGPRPTSILDVDLRTARASVLI